MSVMCANLYLVERNEMKFDFQFFICSTCQEMGTITVSEGAITLSPCDCEELIPFTPTPTPF